MKILIKIYQYNLDCWAELIEIGISEHGTLSLHYPYIYFTTGYDKQVK